MDISVKGKVFMNINARRGFQPEDIRQFTGNALEQVERFQIYFCIIKAPAFLQAPFRLNYDIILANPTMCIHLYALSTSHDISLCCYKN